MVKSDNQKVSNLIPNESPYKTKSRLFVDQNGRLCFNQDPKVYYIDLFCGAGGVSSGVVRGGGKVIYCINHDPIAISSHRANHQGVFHATEDIRTFNLTPLIRVVDFIRKKNPSALICLWASLECTHFSKAKGGEHRDADSRTLAEHLYRYIDAVDPDYIDIENVVEFMSWGPLRMKCAKMHKNKCDLSWDSRFAYQYRKAKRRGKKKKIACDEYYPDRCELKMKHIPHYKMIPKSRDKGKDYVRWYQDICKRFGYDYDYRILNSADFGALTARIRYFGQFKKPFLPFTWPQATHSKNPRNEGLFGSLKPWKAVRPALDLKDEGKSIFGRKVPLSENTLKRIYAGLVKYVGEGKEPEFISQYNSGSENSRCISMDGPLNTIPTNNRFGIVKPEFMVKYHGNGDNILTVEGPSSTLTTKDRIGVVWLDKYYRGKHNHQSVDSPAGTVMTNDKHSKIQCFLFNHNYNNGASDVENPAPTLLASRKHYYILNPQYSSKGNDLNRPCFTLIARMDKMPPYLMEADKGAGQSIIIIYDNDCKTMKNIKLFMAAHGICDIKMRMLKVLELLRIQGFGDQYILKGTQTDQKRFIGNSVEVNLAKCKVAIRISTLKKMYAEHQKQVA